MAIITYLLLVASFLVGYLVKFHISLLDFSVIILWVLSVTKKKFSFHIPKSLFAFLFICSVSLLISKNLTGFPYLFRFFLYSTLPYVLTIKPNQAKKLFYTLCLIAVLTGLFQYLAFPDTRGLAAFGWDDHYYRVIGTFLDPGFTGLIFVLFISTLPIGLVWVVTYLALALTYSRSSYLAFLFTSTSPKRLMLYSILLLLTVLAVPRPAGEGVKLERTSSIQARIINWRQSYQIFKDHLLFGVGFNNYRDAQHRYGFLSEKNWQTSHSGSGADSSLLFVAATTGIFGLVSYLYYLKSLPRQMLIPLLIHSFFLNSLFYPPILLLVALFMVSNSPPPLSSQSS